MPIGESAEGAVKPESGAPTLTVIGGGLAGSEAAWQAAEAGVRTTLYEMRPTRTTTAHQSDQLAELVCSNSLGSDLPDRALGLLKRELRELGSLIIDCADRTSVPAGGALAVGREAFSQAVTEAIRQHPNITLKREEVLDIPDGPAIIASGPLSSPSLAGRIAALAGADHLYFFDAMAPIVAADSIDMSIAFRANRYDRTAEELGGDYINCPMSREEYYAFVDAVNQAEKIDLREFERDDEAKRYFEGCLPIEVLAGRGPDGLAYGPMRPVGLRDPRTGRRPYAVVQLRQDDIAGTLYNLVGFQTNIKWDEQARVLRMIPGLGEAEFVRFGQMHRNTFLDSPRLLRPTLQWHDRATLFFAGQITGTEGYVGSTAGGWLAGVNAARLIHGEEPVAPPETTMMGALFHYVSSTSSVAFQPMKANFGLLPPLTEPIRDKRLRNQSLAVRALRDLRAWRAVHAAPDGLLPE